MKRLFDPILRLLHGKDAGIVGAVVGFGFALLWAIFGFWRTLFILLLTLAGYIVGARFFRNSTHFRELIDKFLPPGRFR
ncbi:MAG: DUF2273 domain-containing protein [Clostridia bacterium]|nr:DUF2273 domain-containing protein [Clostridia bacterium]NLF20601.1 DUF2273 domain-containing protein [Clostridiaceae bacterium]